MTSTKRRTRAMLGTLLSVFVLAGMLALPAQADSVAGLVVWNDGEAVIGNEDIDDENPNKNTCTKADDDGLNFPIVAGDEEFFPSTKIDELGGPQGKVKCYHFEAGKGKSGTCTAIVALNKGATENPQDCNIVANGDVTGWCGNSTGDDGWGVVTLYDSANNAKQEIHIKNINWITSIGSVFTITGTVGKTKADAKDGLLYGAVQAFGENNGGASIAEACFADNGADSFQVRGFAVAVDPTQI